MRWRERVLRREGNRLIDGDVIRGLKLGIAVLRFFGMELIKWYNSADFCYYKILSLLADIQGQLGTL